LKLKFTHKAEKDLEKVPPWLRLQILQKAKARLESSFVLGDTQIKLIFYSWESKDGFRRAL